MTSTNATKALDAVHELNASDVDDDGLYERAIAAAAQHYLAGDNLLAGVCERIAARELAARKRRATR